MNNNLPIHHSWCIGQHNADEMCAGPRAAFPLTLRQGGKTEPQAVAIELVAPGAEVELDLGLSPVDANDLEIAVRLTLTEARQLARNIVAELERVEG